MLTSRTAAARALTLGCPFLTGIGVEVGVKVGVGVWVGVGVSVEVGVTVGVAVLVGIGVALGIGVAVGEEFDAGVTAASAWTVLTGVGSGVIG